MNVSIISKGMQYQGLEFDKMCCAVSIVRSGELPWKQTIVTIVTGEAMERGVRDCFRSICIGKILIQRDPETSVAKVCHMTIT